jgi:5-formaminoimidazole-4-carboxamide-1-beta-D-ribofuranosyl 5'-monophosphate synthetase
MNYAAYATSSQNQNLADYSYSAATHRSRGVLWPMFTPGRIKVFCLQITSAEMLTISVFTNSGRIDRH